MHRKQLSILLMTAGFLAIGLTGLALVTTQPARACSAHAPSAQCGSQISSCKNCHETQGKKPVSDDGTLWHKAHAFGDFCASCHSGNQQATDQIAAHTGLVPPLSDIQASCQQCHPNDAQARAQIFAVALGVTLGSSDQVKVTPTATAATATPASLALAPAAQPAVLAPDDAGLVDYVQRYDQNALGQTPVNWGNVILLALAGLLLLGGGALVLRNEKLVVISFKDTQPVDGSHYPADVVAMVPQLSQLKPAARKSLRRLLGKPEAAADLLASLDKLADDYRKENFNTKDTRDTKEE